jgi:hypothetical protein
MLGRPTTPWGYDSGFLIRGWIVDDLPCTIVIATSARKGSSVRREMRRICGVEGRSFAGMRRHDWREHVEEGVVLDDFERGTLIVAASRREFVSLTIRTPDDDLVAAPVEAVVASFRVTP